MFKRTSRFGVLLSNLHSHSPRSVLLLSTCHLRKSCPRLRPLSSLPAHDKDRIEVRVGGSGHVGLDLWRPRASEGKRRNSLVIYLPPGPHLSLSTCSISGSGLSDSLPEILPTSAFARIDYRLSTPDLSNTVLKPVSSVYTYPQPIHDVSVAFSHLVKDIAPSLFPGREPPHIILVGSRIGASLASMLALTNPEEVDAVFAIEPMVDWVILDELGQTKTDDEESLRKRAPKQAEKELVAQAARRLIDTRTKLFRSPSAYFDAFASPTLFLRAPGQDTPRTHAEALGFVSEDNDDWEASEEYEKAHQPLDGPRQDINSVTGLAPGSDASNSDLVDQPKAAGSSPSTSYGPYDDDQPHAAHSAPINSPLPPSSRQVKRRKVLRRWPPNYSSSNIPPLLPYFNVVLTPFSAALHVPADSKPEEVVARDADRGMHALLHAQGTEFADLLKRACFFGREGGIAEKRVKLREVEDGKLGWEELASWLQQADLR